MRLAPVIAIVFVVSLSGCERNVEVQGEHTSPFRANAGAGGALEDQGSGGSAGDANPTAGAAGRGSSAGEGANDAGGSAPDPGAAGSVASDVLLDSYEIKYIRSDGRGTEGVDVPYRITGPLAVLVESEGEATFALEVVRRQAKLDPPLTNIQQTTILTVTAQITLFGKTTSEKRVTTTGSLQIDFADFGDEETFCPQN